MWNRIKESKFGAAGGTAVVRRDGVSDVCLARVFRDLTPFASAVQTHNQQPYLAKAKALPPPIPYLHSRHAIPLCTLSTSLYKVHLPDSPLLTSLSKA